MTTVKTKNRDIEKNYTTAQFVEKLRRFADCLERGDSFDIQIEGERLYVPKDAIVSIEHEREGNVQELEFQIKWKK